MKIFCKCPTVNISKRNFWFVICIAKNLIWTTLKAIFSIFGFFYTLRFQIFKYLCLSLILSDHNKPYINGKIMYSAFRWWINLNCENIDSYDWFCGPWSHLWLFKTWFVEYIASYVQKWTGVPMVNMMVSASWTLFAVMRGIRPISPGITSE